MYCLLHFVVVKVPMFVYKEYVWFSKCQTEMLFERFDSVKNIYIFSMGFQILK